MSAKHARFLANPKAAAAMIAEAEREAAGAPAPEVPAPKAAAALALEPQGGKWVGACPACQEQGKDSKGNHLVMFEDGAWGCIINRGESGQEHRRRMAELCPELRGKKGGPARPRVSFEEEKAAISEGFLVLWKMIKEKLWTEIEDLPRFLGEGAPVPTDLAGSVAVFCKAFKAGDWAWVGNRHDQNEEEWGKLTEDKKKWQTRFRDHLFDPASAEDRARIVALIEKQGLDHASGYVWQAEATGRGDDQHTGTLRFRIVEHDKDGGEPTPLGAQLAAIRYAREVLNWKLLWIMRTGGKGVHAAFDTSGISPMQITADLSTLRAIGCDPNGLERGATRCPGALRRAISRHQKPKPQALVWVSKDL